MKRHTVWGEELLAGRASRERPPSPARATSTRTAAAILTAFAGGCIPKVATIVAVADAVDAMTHDRPCRSRRSARPGYARDCGVLRNAVQDPGSGGPGAPLQAQLGAFNGQTTPQSVGRRMS